MPTSLMEQAPERGRSYARFGAFLDADVAAAGLDAGRPPLGNAIIKTAVLQFGL